MWLRCWLGFLVFKGEEGEDGVFVAEEPRGGETAVETGVGVCDLAAAAFFCATRSLAKTGRGREVVAEEGVVE